MRHVGVGIAAALCVAGWMGVVGCSPDRTVGVENPEATEAPAEQDQEPGPDPVTLLPEIPDPAELPPNVSVSPELVDGRPKPFVAKPCPAIFSDDQLQEFHVTIDGDEWGALRNEFQNGEAMKLLGQEVEVYQPLTAFAHEGRAVTNAMIRLRGNTAFWPRQQKMQFQISFNEIDKEGRYQGLRKIVLDSAYYNTSYLRDRLAMSIARDVGLPAPCVNHARLYVNGDFYGLYTHIEKVDREFLERNFEDPSANLYKRGQWLRTNQDEAADTSRLTEFWNATKIEDLEKLAQLQQLVRNWAAEAVFPDADGYWAGGWNFYLYDEPGKGFAYILWDVDLAFSNLPAETDPLTWHKENLNFNGRPHVEAVLKDPKWRGEFIKEVRTVRNAIDVPTLQARIDKWAAQIDASVQEDPHKPWTYDQYAAMVQSTREYVAERVAFIDQWLACWEAHADDPKFDGPCP